MAPLRTHSNWNVRQTDKVDKVEPYIRYYFLCEGKNTEFWYFEKMIDVLREFSVKSNVELINLEKIDDDQNLSNPKKLIVFGNDQIENKKIIFDKKIDKLIIVFDYDIYERQGKSSTYDELLSLTKSYNILGVTNPSFELFLILHKKDSFKNIIKPNESNIIKNDWDNRKQKIRYIEKLCRNCYDMKPKANRKIGEIAENIKIAIEEEKMVNRNINDCSGKVTSNIGDIINRIITEHST